MLRELLKNYVAARERAEQQFNTTKTDSTEEPCKPMIMVSSAEALMERSQGVNNRKDRTTLSSRCRFFYAYHRSDECPKYTTMESRKQRIKGCCYICLRDGHNASEYFKKG